MHTASSRIYLRLSRYHSSTGMLVELTSVSRCLCLLFSLGEWCGLKRKDIKHQLSHGWMRVLCTEKLGESVYVVLFVAS
jgi:hypothetical protein